MGATQFKRAELEDQEIISHYFEHHTSRSCERTFANVYLWSRQYPVNGRSSRMHWYSKVRMRITYPLPTRPEHRKM